MTAPFAAVTGLLRGMQGRRRQDVEDGRYEQERMDRIARQNEETLFRREQLKAQTDRQNAQDDIALQARRREATEAGYRPQAEVQAQGQQLAEMPTSPLPDFTGVTAALRGAGMAAQRAPEVYKVGGVAMAKGGMSEAERTREDQQAQARELRDTQSRTSMQIAADALAGRQEMQREQMQGRKELAGIVAANRPQRPMQTVPAGVVDAMTQTRATLGTIDDALGTINTGKADGHIGPMRRFMPNFVSQMTDPEGNAIRGQLSGLGATIRHELSGAAITPSEAQFLEPDIPAPDDDPKTAKQKLERLRKKLSQIDADKRLQYSPENGYRNAIPAPAEPMINQVARPPAAAPSPRARTALPPVDPARQAQILDALGMVRR